jgi:YD repeat-containing protein
VREVAASRPGRTEARERQAVSRFGNQSRPGIVDTADNVLAVMTDDLGRKTEVTDPDRGKWTFGWDGLGRLRFQKDARGVETWSQYDALGRIENRFIKAPQDAGKSLDATWFYDRDGRIGALSTVQGADGLRREYRYDDLLRPHKVTTVVPRLDSGSAPDPSFRTFVLQYGYDLNYGRQKAIRYPSGETVALDYDDRGHEVGETEIRPDGSRGEQYRRVNALSPRGQVADQTFGNCSVEVTQFDGSSGMALFMSAMRPAIAGSCPAMPSQPVRQIEYRHDHFLNLSWQQKNFIGGQATETYSYDDLQRILSSTRTWVGSGLPATSETDAYAYDDLGNITKKTDYASNYSYDPSRPHAVASVLKPSLPTPLDSDRCGPAHWRRNTVDHRRRRTRTKARVRLRVRCWR